MGTTADKGAYLNNTKSLLKQKINNLGGDITDETTFRQYADKLQAIYNNLPKTEYTEGTSVQLENTLKGKIDFEDDKLGYGDSEQESTTGSQLWKPYNFTKTNGNGINWEVKSDGTINASGTATATSTTAYSSEISSEFYTLPAGSYIISGATSKILLEVINSSGTRIALTTSSETSKTFTLASDTLIQIRGYITSGTALTGTETIKPMINTGSTALNWEQYTGGNQAPNPDYPFPIKSVTGVQSINFKGANKLNVPKSLTINPRNIDVECDLPAGTYTIHCSKRETTDSQTASAVNLYDGGNNLLTSFQFSSSNSFTITGVAKLVRIYSSNNYNNSANTTTTYTDLMINEGNTALPYQPYITPVEKTIDLGTLELCKIGDYQDYIYKNNGKWYKHQAILKFILGNIAQIRTGEIFGVNKQYATYRLTGAMTGSSPNYNFFCNKVTKANGVATNCTGYMVGQNFVVIVDDNDTVESVNQKFSDAVCITTAQSQYITDIELTDTDLISQLEDFYNSQSYDDTTIIEVTGDLPMGLKVRALKGE